MNSGIDNIELNRDVMEKGGVDVLGLEIVPNFKHQFIAPRLKCFTLKQGRIGSAIGVGDDRTEKRSSRFANPVEGEFYP